jgi:hypothetical protein
MLLIWNKNLKKLNVFVKKLDARKNIVNVIILEKNAEKNVNV